jgi:hypothetical protein
MTFAQRSRRVVRRRLLALSLLVAAVGSLGATPFTSGITYKLRFVINMPAMPGMNGGDIVVVTHGASTDGRTRLDVDSVDAGAAMMGPFQAGDYFLMLDSGRTVLVQPATKSYIDGFSTAMGSLPPELMASAVVSNVVVKVEKLGAGEAIEGRPTERSRLSVQYTMQIMGQSMNFDNESEISSAQLPVTIRNPFSGDLPKAMATGPFAELYAKATGAVKELTGTPLKISASTAISGATNVTLTQTMAVTDVKPADVDAKLLEIPAGFVAKPLGR